MTERTPREWAEKLRDTEAALHTYRRDAEVAQSRIATLKAQRDALAAVVRALRDDLDSPLEEMPNSLFHALADAGLVTERPVHQQTEPDRVLYEKRGLDAARAALEAIEAERDTTTEAPMPDSNVTPEQLREDAAVMREQWKRLLDSENWEDPAPFLRAADALEGKAQRMEHLPSGPDAANDLFAAASDLRHLASGGALDHDTITAHADVLLAMAKRMEAAQTTRSRIPIASEIPGCWVDGVDDFVRVPCGGRVVLDNEQARERREER